MLADRCVSGPSLFRPYLFWHSRGPVQLGRIRERCGRRRARSRSVTRRPTTTYRRGRRGIPAARIVDDPPAIFLAWSERARAVSTRFDVPGRAWPRHPRARCASGGRAADTRRTTAATDHGQLPNPPHRHPLRADSGAGRGPAAARLRLRLASVLQRGTRESIVTGNQNVATRAAEEIRRYISGHADILKALAANLQDTGLSRGSRIASSRTTSCSSASSARSRCSTRRAASIATSRVGTPRVDDPDSDAPVTSTASRCRRSASTRICCRPRVFAHPPDAAQSAVGLAGRRVQPRRDVADGRPHPHRRAAASRWSSRPTATLVAHGDPDKKALVAQATNMSGHPLVAAAGRERDTPVALEYRDEDGREQLGVAARIRRSAGRVIVEQPTSEAYASATALQRQLDRRHRARAARHGRASASLRPARSSRRSSR